MDLHRVFLLIPVHNRRTTTIVGLRNLQETHDLDRWGVVVIDDGSTDGTADEIAAMFPQVTVLKGDGNLWWAGAIYKGMEHAYRHGAEFFVWLNDDTLPLPNAIADLVSFCAAAPHRIATAQCYTDTTLTQTTYGGRAVKGFYLKMLTAAPGETTDCDVCSGNLVCLPRSVVDMIGHLPWQQTPQTWADVVYTWQAKQAGFEIKVLGSAMAICPKNTLEVGWASSPIPMIERWKMLNSPKSSIYPPAYGFYCKSLYGVLGIVPFIQVYLRLIAFTVIRAFIPLKILEYLKGLKDEL